MLRWLSRKGEEWQKHRTALNRDMMRPKTVSGYTDTLNGVVDDMVVYFDSYIGSEGEVVDLEGLLLRWSLECKSAIKLRFVKRSTWHLCIQHMYRISSFLHVHVGTSGHGI